MTDDPWTDPGYLEWAEHVRTEMLPKLRASELSMMLYTGSVDVKIAVELGYALLLDKPIVVAAVKGAKVTGRLRQVADEILYLDLDDDGESAKHLGMALKRMADRGLIPPLKTDTTDNEPDTQASSEAAEGPRGD